MTSSSTGRRKYRGVHNTNTVIILKRYNF